ncbi:MAG: LPS export ABC transporter periplasmic protein LptC [Candidatus Eremiobacteraeota bacterium]|nr:LPS export ABC transporter periplasmic protein LptC [Candidatus Eremiobacteraeota bacterium]
MPVPQGMQVGKFTINFELGDFKRDGEFVVPGAVSGNSTDGDFRADHAIGNWHRGQVTLVGHVLLHQRFGVNGAAGQPPMTLTSDQFHIDSKVKTYLATGAVKVVQGSRTLVADAVQLNDATHDMTFTGNVHAQDPQRSIDSQEVHYNNVTGAILIPVAVSGRSADGDFRADRATGDQHTGMFSLFGNVVVHKAGGISRSSKTHDTVTLRCDQLDIATQTKQYDANGHVEVSQANRVISAPHLTLNDTTHLAVMTGGVHGLERPDRTFDSAEVHYNTETEDFKALGGVRVTFPYRRGGSKPTPTP